MSDPTTAREALSMAEQMIPSDPYDVALHGISLSEGDWHEVRLAVLVAARAGTDPAGLKRLVLDLASALELINRQTARLESAPGAARG